jgi:hypothetical protein
MMAVDRSLFFKLIFIDGWVWGVPFFRTSIRDTGFPPSVYSQLLGCGFRDKQTVMTVPGTRKG